MDIKSGDEQAFTNAIATIGPISSAVDASQSSFQLYSSGIYSDPACSSSQLDHGLTAVGYGTMNGQDYYIARNMWGTSWGKHFWSSNLKNTQPNNKLLFFINEGDKGYMLLARNKGNMCGFSTMPSYPLV